MPDVALAALIITLCVPQAPTPDAALARSAPCPTLRNAHALVYDGARRRLILFGGADDARVLGTTWERTARGWRPSRAGGPSPRTFPAAAYDDARRAVVLFGGKSVLFGVGDDANTFLGDTWELRGGRWRAVRAPGPAPRAEAAMAYDSRRRRVVLFGGYDRRGGASRRFGDTWEWDGARWERIDVEGAVPAPRNNAAMAYDAARGRVVLFGGSTGRPSGETWEWDGRRWERVASADEARYNCAMAYDARRGRIVRFGGWDGAKRRGDTWEWDGAAWRLVSETGPEPRNHAAMAFDAARGRVVLVGGHEGSLVFGDAWEWDGGSWSHATVCAPRARVDNGH
jgi:hypothetical protein